MLKVKGFKCLIMRCVIAATEYSIWMKRNIRVFQNKPAIDQLALKLFNSIRDFFCVLEGVRNHPHGISL
ncbi:hypothetical protein RHMOL_Rhmol08G0216800 [Rhododendron molle]|uniref:Uncharacterized protein n=1 Tax=Rhododendron molle TaxID=49168 RepID=A0ACC0MS21_RHOML|nr:hypothetical protein RHMOL_Rhmol08G0216800 [Rhododendron molle]